MVMSLLPSRLCSISWLRIVTPPTGPLRLASNVASARISGSKKSFKKAVKSGPASKSKSKSAVRAMPTKLEASREVVNGSVKGSVSASGSANAKASSPSESAESTASMIGKHGEFLPTFASPSNPSKSSSQSNRQNVAAESFVQKHYVVPFNIFIKGVGTVPQDLIYSFKTYIDATFMKREKVADRAVIRNVMRCVSLIFCSVHFSVPYLMAGYQCQVDRA